MHIVLYYIVYIVPFSLIKNTTKQKNNSKWIFPPLLPRKKMQFVENLLFKLLLRNLPLKNM